MAIIISETGIINTRAVKEDMVCIAVPGVPRGRWAYYVAKMYIAKRRADGVLTWRADEELTLAHTSPSKCLAELPSKWDGIPRKLHVRHGTVCA